MCEVTRGKGNREQFQDLMDFLNLAFACGEPGKDLQALLPKMYQLESTCCEDNYLVLEGGKIKAAVGAYDQRIKVCDVELSCRGIGNVAVHPYSRGKGYMTNLMEQALEDMIRDGVDFSWLGGQRQRYNYFSYEHGGVSYIYNVNQTNMRHHFGEEKSPVTIEEIQADQEQYLDVVEALRNSGQYVPVRDRNKLYQICCSWHGKPYLLKNGEQVKGYFILNDKDVNEICLYDKKDFMNAVRCIVEQFKQIRIILPAFCQDYRQMLAPVAEGMIHGGNEMFSVFCFRRVLEAFLKLKATYEELPDGCITILIHGRAGEEHLQIAIKDGNITVEETIAKPQVELSHLEAIRFFFGLDCVEREKQSYYVRCLFPVPIWIYPADGV